MSVNVKGDQNKQPFDGKELKSCVSPNCKGPFSA